MEDETPQQDAALPEEQAEVLPDSNGDAQKPKSKRGRGPGPRGPYQRKEKISRLSVMQERALPLVMRCVNYDEIGRIVGAHPNTVREWLKHPAFKLAIAEARATLLDATIADIRLANQKAFATLERLCDHTDPRIAMKAAMAIAAFHIRNIELNDCMARLSRLEAYQGLGKDILLIPGPPGSPITELKAVNV